MKGTFFQNYTCLLRENGIKLWADYKYEKIYFNKNGISKCFHQLPLKFSEILLKELQANPITYRSLKTHHKHINSILEAYVFSMYSFENKAKDLSFFKKLE